MNTGPGPLAGHGQLPAAPAADPLFEAFVLQVRALARDDIADRRRAEAVGAALAGLAHAGWQMPDPRYRALQPDAPYGSWLLHLDPASGLSVVLDVFGPGQVAAIHNHCCWGAFACLAGAERERSYTMRDGSLVESATRLMQCGDVAVVMPPGDDFHQVENASERASISLHVYGRDIGRIERLRWEDGRTRAFRSGYSNDLTGLPAYTYFG